MEDIPFEKLLELKKNGNIDRPKKRARTGQLPVTNKRANKNQPTEVSSKIRTPKVREVITVKKVERIDPRFSELSGKLNHERFMQSYSFLNDDEELNDLQQQLKKTKDNNEKIKIKNEISKIREQKMTRKINQSIKERKLEIKHNENESVSKGKQPFYLKRKEIKKIEQEERIKEVQKEGKYGKYMKRKSEKEFKKNRVNSKY